MVGKTEKLNIVQAINRGLYACMEEDDNVLVMGEDVGVDGGVFRVTDGLVQAFGPDRVIDTPLAESGIVGTAIGMSVMGFRPVAEIQFMGFVYPAVNQLMGHAARYRNRTRGRFTCPLVVRMPYGGGIHPPEHHSESYESLFIHTPGIKVVIPSTPYDAKGLLISAVHDNDPVLYLEPKAIYRAFREEVPSGLYEVPIGKANVVREGTDITLISYGAMMRPLLQAQEILSKEGVSAEVIDLRTVSPLDAETVIASVTKTGRAVVVHEAPKTNGLGGEIAALISERALLHLLAPVERVAGFDVAFPFPLLEKNYLPNRDRIVKAARKALDF
ncbi:MAG: alpha-ketoacid dehydrogenase subunit beta [Acidobacteriota bacterium]